MQVIRGIHNIRPEHKGCAAAIGTFDGVHMGHQAVLRQSMGIARELRLPATVISFEPTPREFFSKSPPARLTRFREKVQAFTMLGLDRFVCLRFDTRLQSLTPSEFVDDLLVDRLGLRHLVVGQDFRFGLERAGSYATLVEAGRRHGFAVASTPELCVDGIRASSTAVREALARGDLAQARRLLGRPYRMCGRVVPGNRLGRSLGFATANINVHRRVVPLSGIFAVQIGGLGSKPWPGVASLGVRPTVGGVLPLLEAHLFDFDGDLYGHALDVDFIAKLRDEKKFPSVEALTEQMRRDAQRARSILDVDRVSSGIDQPQFGQESR